MGDLPRVFVTGATGFIGTRLVNELVRRGHAVQGLTRANSNRKGLEDPRIRLVMGDILDRDSLLRGMEGCTQVYHLAAYAKNWARERDVFFQYNVTGTENVFEAARQAGVGRIVFTSTIVTFGPTPPGVVADETLSRITPHCYTEYEESKVVAEKMAVELAQAGRPIVIVNPTRVYGPGKLTEGNSVTQMIDLYTRGRLPLLLNRGVDVGNYVLVDDLVQGYVLAMEKGKVGEKYILGGENASLARFFELVDEISGRKRRLFNLPPAVALFYSRIERWKAQTLGFYPKVTPGWVETFLQDWTYQCGKAERELGYRITPLREGIRQTCQWLKEQRKPA
jgi:nucleoside-diphosphate-sugar epimerase